MGLAGPGGGYALWDHDWDLTARQVQLAREAGALGQLPFLLSRMTMDAVRSGDFAAAAVVIAEADAVRAATGSRLMSYYAAMLAAFRGREAEAAPLIQATLEQAAAGGQGGAVTWAHWAAAVLCNGLGRYEEALAAARQAREHEHAFASAWALPELIEAAARTGSMRIASDALDLLAERARAGGTDWGLGLEARSRALLSEGEEAERLYLEAIGRLGRTRLRPDLARAHLLYGEWLRQQRRRGEAREQLRTAHSMLEAIGLEGFAGRARRELRATGETARRRVVAAADGELTVQEAQIARLARDGLSNPEIGARLFLSPRTVQLSCPAFSGQGICGYFTLLPARSGTRPGLPAVSDTRAWSGDESYYSGARSTAQYHPWRPCGSYRRSGRQARSSAYRSPIPTGRYRSIFRSVRRIA